MQLREYQADLMTGLNDAVIGRGIRKPLIVSPTGSGKSVCISNMAWKYFQRGRRVWIVVHRQELLQQIGAALKSWNIPHGFIAAGSRSSPRELVQVCMVASLAKRLAGLEAPHLLIIDEAHHAVSKTYLDIFVHCQASLTVGFTATPERLDGRGLGDIFGGIVMGPTVGWLMEHGFLSKAKYWAPPMVADYSGVATTAGDYNSKQSAQVMCRADVTGDCVQHYLRLSRGLPAVAFCVNIAHSEQVAENFRAAGVPASVIHSGLSADARRDAVLDLASGKIHVLTSCDIINEGFDLPVVTTAILLRKTQSLGLHLQQIGRVLRPHPSKSHSIVIDHVGNLLTHGCAEDEREWSLESAKRKKSSPSEPPTVQCQECYAVYPASAKACPECGDVREAPPARETIISDEELQEFTPAPRLFGRDLSAAARQCKTHADFAALGKQQGYKPGWAWHAWKQLCEQQNQRSKPTSEPSPEATSGSSATPPASANAGAQPSVTASPAGAVPTSLVGRLSA
ncbi:MAG: DEAD/DEAH box helicase [Verrucomicrobiaceae bacterium]|nr:MAG: DEAD/DEAH box helicase [Verrucomicrobiaceae bacterium]